MVPGARAADASEFRVTCAAYLRRGARAERTDRHDITPGDVRRRARADRTEAVARWFVRRLRRDDGRLVGDRRRRRRRWARTHADDAAAAGGRTRTRRRLLRLAARRFGHRLRRGRWRSVVARDRRPGGDGASPATVRTYASKLRRSLATGASPSTPSTRPRCGGAGSIATAPPSDSTTDRPTSASTPRSRSTGPPRCGPRGTCRTCRGTRRVSSTSRSTDRATRRDARCPSVPAACISRGRCRTDRSSPSATTPVGSTSGSATARWSTNRSSTPARRGGWGSGRTPCRPTEIASPSRATSAASVASASPMSEPAT